MPLNGPPKSKKWTGGSREQIGFRIKTEVIHLIGAWHLTSSDPVVQNPKSYYLITCKLLKWPSGMLGDVCLAKCSPHDVTLFGNNSNHYYSDQRLHNSGSEVHPARLLTFFSSSMFSFFFSRLDVFLVFLNAGSFRFVFLIAFDMTNIKVVVKSLEMRD